LDLKSGASEHQEYTGKYVMSQHVIAAVDDMFFASKIRATAEHLGLAVSFPRNTETLLAQARTASPALIIFDLHSQRFEPFITAEALKADKDLQSVPLVGFFSHVQTDLQRRAADAGFERIMPRSAFTKHLAEILQNGQSV
jgi:PleD family two-component response regulator